jgi:hypothetical protein
MGSFFAHWRWQMSWKNHTGSKSEAEMAGQGPLIMPGGVSATTSVAPVVPDAISLAAHAWVARACAVPIRSEPTCGSADGAAWSAQWPGLTCR